MIKTTKGSKRRDYKSKRQLRRLKGVWNHTQNVLRKKLDCDLAIYAVQNQLGSTYYSFGTGSSPIYGLDFFNVVTGLDEFKRLGACYGLCRVTGISIQYARAVNAAVNTIYTLPDINLMVAPEENTSFITKESFYSADGGMRVQPLSTDARPLQKYYRWTGDYTGGQGYTIAGPRGWMSTNAILTSSNSKYFVYVGWSIDPTFSGAGNVPIGSVKVTVYMEFGLPRFRTAV